jgi:hypothetical protein
MTDKKRRNETARQNEEDRATVGSLLSLLLVKILGVHFINIGAFLRA